VVVFHFTELRQGTGDLYLRTRATAVGRFVQPPARAQALFAEETWGRSGGAAVEVVR
jgi:uncharacterized protein YfaS (alpha-2-macroglobulin family)